MEAKIKYVGKNFKLQIVDNLITDNESFIRF